MRAVSKDFETARLMAINVDTIVALTFTIGSALAAFERDYVGDPLSGGVS